VTINIPSDHAITQTGSTGSNSISHGSGGIGRSLGSTGGDRFSASSTASGIQSSLDQIETQRASRVAKLTQLYSAGRYMPESTALAKSLVEGSVSVGIR
jgi:hypothetical protein